MDICTIRDYAQAFSGYAFSSEDLVDAGHPVLKIGNIQNHHILKETDSYYCKSITDRLKKYQFRKDDFLIAMTGAGSVGRAGKMIDFEEGYLVNQRVAIIRPDLSKTDPDYLFYYFSMGYVEKYLYNLGIGAGQPNISANDILKTKVSFPKLTKQKRIGEILSTYDTLIENNNKRIKLLEQMAENIYKEWFVRFRFPGCETAEFENGFPKNWEQIRLGEKMTFIRGKSYSSADIQDGDKVLLSMNSIRPYGGFIRDFTRVYGGKYQDKHVIKYGDLIMSITDMTQDRRIIGYVGMFDSNRTDCIMSTHLMKIETDIDHLFVLNFFNVSGLSRMIAEFATGANVLGLTDSILKRIKAVFPPNDLIVQYGKAVKPYYDMIAALKNENDNLIKQRDLLLPRLMSGKLEV